MATFDPSVLDGKRILLTGGGGGLGQAIAPALVAHGARVHLWGRRENALREVAEPLGDLCTYDTVDVRDYDAVDAGVERYWNEHGPLTGLINNAAANFIAQSKTLSPRAYRAVTSTVQDGSFHCAHACGKRWIEEDIKGSIVSMLVTWVFTGSAFALPSAMAKTAVHAMTMSLAAEWGPFGIRVNALAPGPFPTEYAWKVLSQADGSNVGATDKATVPMRRFGEMPELQNILIFLMSDACDYLTGATIPVDGGHHLAAPSTFIDLATLSDADWQRTKDAAKQASDEAKSQRSTG